MVDSVVEWGAPWGQMRGAATHAMLLWNVEERLSAAAVALRPAAENF